MGLVCFQSDPVSRGRVTRALAPAHQPDLPSLTASARGYFLPFSPTVCVTARVVGVSGLLPAVPGTSATSTNTDVQSQTTVSAYFTSKQILSFVIAEQITFPSFCCPNLYSIHDIW